VLHRPVHLAAALLACSLGVAEAVGDRRLTHA
jgi:hypothetical protein